MDEFAGRVAIVTGDAAGTARGEGPGRRRPGGAAETVAAAVGDAAEVAELVAFLASDRASNTTGAYYLTDGGYTAQ